MNSDAIVIQYVILAIFGLMAGSFFNVLIWRIPREKSIAWPPSHCTACGGKIKWHDNVPVVSYVFLLRGKCRHCKVPISIIYPIVEILTAAALVGSWTLLGMPETIENMRAWYELAVPILRIISIIMMVPMAVIDIRHYIIPDRFTIPFFFLALGLSFIPGDLTFTQSLLGALAGGGSLLAMGLIGTFVLKKGDAMGMGDVKLMAYLGALWGAKTALFGIAFGAFLGAIAGGTMIIFKRLGDDHRIPFGPFLGMGTVTAIFAGEPLLEWYLGFFK